MRLPYHANDIVHMMQQHAAPDVNSAGPQRHPPTKRCRTPTPAHHHIRASIGVRQLTIRGAHSEGESWYRLHASHVATVHVFGGQSRDLQVSQSSQRSGGSSRSSSSSISRGHVHHLCECSRLQPLRAADVDYALHAPAVLYTLSDRWRHHKTGGRKHSNRPSHRRGHCVHAYTRGRCACTLQRLTCESSDHMMRALPTVAC